MTRHSVNRTGSRATLATWGFLPAAGLAVMALPSTAPAVTAAETGGPDKVFITGTVRDFRAANSDFNVNMPAGYGHYAGNVALDLGADGRPVYDGGGYKVSFQWRNEEGRPIPPHLSTDSSDHVYLATAPTIDNAPIIDTYDSFVGPYDPLTAGSTPEFISGSSMPAVAAPSNLPSYQETIAYGGDLTETLATNLYCRDFKIQNGFTLRISGEVFIYATESFKADNLSKIELLDGASLTVYVAKDCQIQNASSINMNTGDPSRFTLINLGSTMMVLENGSNVCGRIVAPDATLRVKNGNQFYGNFIGESVIIDNEAGFHIDLMGATVCGTELNDDAGARGAASDGGLVSADRFVEWYSDVLGVNRHAAHTIALTKNEAGIYEYLDSAFFPIDDWLYGNEGMAHNYYFTFAFSIEFVHRGCDGRFFEFEGADDAWLFIDGKLAMDLGGILPGYEQVVEIDRMELLDGETYRMDFFYAQRNDVTAEFRMRTNLDLVSNPNSASTSPEFD